MSSSENLVPFSMSGVTRSLLPEFDTNSPVREPFNMNSDPETEIISISASFEFGFFVELTRLGEIAKWRPSKVELLVEYDGSKILRSKK